MLLLLESKATSSNNAPLSAAGFHRLHYNVGHKRRLQYHGLFVIGALLLEALRLWKSHS